MHSGKRKRSEEMIFSLEVETHEAISHSFCRTTGARTTPGKIAIASTRIEMGGPFYEQPDAELV